MMFAHGLRLPWQLDPLEAMRRWPADRPLLMLHSGRLHPRWARYSLLASPTGAYRFDLLEDGTPRGRWVGNPDAAPTADWHDDPFADLNLLRQQQDVLWLGHLGYDLARSIENLPTEASIDRHWPVVQMHQCRGWLVYDSVEQAWHAHGTWRDGEPPNLPALSPRDDLGFHADQPRSVMSRADYESMIERARQYIAAGDVFQVNLAQRFTAPFTGEPRALFQALAEASPAWYGAMLELMPADTDEPRRSIVSTSPELFLEVRPGGQVTTRPIKGTRPVSATADELRGSEKDAAELHMIVDLLRNDLGRVCRYGSVEVVEARSIETHPTVHHGVSTIIGRLQPDKNAIDLLRAAMPGGSITGAPKVRAMQIIDELEPVRRGPYCGSIGYLYNDTARFNIAIRTLLVETDARSRSGRVDFSVGGGIVADSQPAAEYQETLDKAAAMMRALEQAEGSATVRRAS
ncbi:anthranilate synthase component I family protein [Phycisphaerales bacterium AB-hyl4]|uniref:Anthranilate synthase component I family protein n=1 Tax=Natronomicrosphaera hydrolytica TaxID=3242702 RepID=A0ABV4U1I1_9BACT